MQKYHKIMVATHWIIAFLMLTVMTLITTLMIIKNVHPDPKSLDSFLFVIFIGHETFGFFLLIFCIWRILAYFLFRSSIPASLNAKGGLSYYGEKLAHFFLRFGLIIVPILGWLTANAKGYPLKLFWQDAFRMPDLVPLGDPSKADTNSFYHQLHEAHELFAYAAMAIVALHIVAVLYHSLKKERILDRMKF